MTERNYSDNPETADDREGESEDADLTWPWSFILLIVAGALYLILRLVEFVIKLVR